jgi:tripartite-type tricarboxylate transporter receptor subunit TctC
MKILKSLTLFVYALCFAAGAVAGDYPIKPVKVIVPYTQGSATDVLAHLVTAKLAAFWGQPVTVENRPGAGGSMGTAAVAKSAPDGYTLLVHSSSYAVNQATYASLPYSGHDFVEIAPFASQPFTLVAGPAAGVKTVAALIAAAKAEPGQMKFASAGTGTSTHLIAERFAHAAGIKLQHVPFKGGPGANAAVAAGKAAFWFPPTAIAIKGIEAGKFLPLGVTGATRSVLLPQVPTLAEAGLPGFEAKVWWGMWAPAAIPVAVRLKLTKDVARALAATDLKAQLKQRGFEVMHMTPAQFSHLVRDEVAAAARTLKEAGLSPK